MEAGRQQLAELYSAAHQNVYSFHLSNRSGMGLKKAFEESPVGVAQFTKVSKLGLTVW